MSSPIDDDFDWVAAVAEIDKACSRHVTQENGAPEPSSSQSRAKHQKTLDSFVRGGAKKRSNVSEAPAQQGTGGALDSSRQGDGYQQSKWDDNKPREFSSDGEQASSSGCQLPLDYDAAKVWIYPANVPRRSYQFDISESALFSNTLVCLPTGLGKTLIAAVVMYNYFRWFPTGKIVFTAPSRPLVVQQIEACHKVTGIPQSMTIDMTGQMNPLIRAEHWQSKRVFFVTPQVLEKDIQAGRAATKQIVCLVVDEAHRASGNYSYCVVIRELLSAKVEPRILALTATPGSKQITVQAVVDNLQISSLEYRDEHDPDVSQYTHNRDIEVIEVPMNAESTQVTEVFTEVLQPIVHRLCYLGVFYSREISRLTPYEFLTARDKFRQAPPPAIQHSKYQEVETYFGLAITLFHVFKLLITHGMRPAYEMLREKVGNGVLRRLAKNEKLLQVQELMKQSIGHGAPSPKLDKVVDIINDHFSVHDAANTRVIIFTNFRESVKDILDKLAAACESVKAMEFIGQSSGKTSKGQTQKTQQAVLQRFRGGCYNTIVATSIAEEGLDIMEVDLVICFDANISPLRMIQRMGRTGRKRDGRVVVLASGGSEIQGYLKKQGKSKALGKHMLHGGVKSFNFHESHRMIPHSLRTAVQFVELAIEDFIPRGRKVKEKDLTVAAGPRKLTEKELEIVRLVKEIPDLNSRMKGGPEDPVNRFFACPVYKVKHSKRSCLLMDCLQTLGVPVQLTNQDRISRDSITPPSPVELSVENDVSHSLNEIQVPTLPVCEILSDDSEPELDPSKFKSTKPTDSLPTSPSSPDSCMIVEAASKDLPSSRKVLSEQMNQEGVLARNTITSSKLYVFQDADKPVPLPGHDEQADGDFEILEEWPLTPIANKACHVDHLQSGDRKAKLVTQGAYQQRSFPFSEQPGVDYGQNLDLLQGTGSPGCRKTSGVVSDSVSIVSPPSLLLSKTVGAMGLRKPSDGSAFPKVNSEAFQHIETERSTEFEQKQPDCFSPLPSPRASNSSGDATPVCQLALGPDTIERIAAAPDGKVVDSCCKESGLKKDVIQWRSLRFDEELSPRLADFANHGVVPSSPRLAEFVNDLVVPDTPPEESTPIPEKASVSSLLGADLTEGPPCLPSDGQNHMQPIRVTLNSQKKPPRNPIPYLSLSSTPAEKKGQFQSEPPQKTIAHPSREFSPLQPRNLTNMKAGTQTFDSLRTERLALREKSIRGFNNGNFFSNLAETVQSVGDDSRAKIRSPLKVLNFNKSNEEDWQIKEGEASGPVQKPRHMKTGVNHGNTNLEETVQYAGDHSTKKTISPLQIQSSNQGNEEDCQIKEGEGAGSVRKPRRLKTGVNDGNNFSDLKETVQYAGDHSAKKTRSPLQILSSNKSNEEDWQIKEGEATGSVRKPRQLKRLRRASEKVPIASEQMSSRKTLNRSIKDQARSKVPHSNLDREKQRRKIAARAFIDEEAEVSSEEDESSGQEDCADEEGSSLEGFIDTAATQQLNGSVDMINIYRKSLLTQSPQINLRYGIATPSSDATPSSIDPSSSRGLEDDLSDFSTAPSVRKSSVFCPQDTVQVTRSRDLAMDTPANGVGKAREAVAPETGAGAGAEGSEDQDRRKADIRKRKLSFQSSPSYEDDLFAGVDLDALEAEATQISRMRTQGQVVSSNVPQEPLREQVVARPSSVPSRPSKDVEFEFIPSFDLGLDT